jgi:hypothetical protein
MCVFLTFLLFSSEVMMNIFLRFAISSVLVAASCVQATAQTTVSPSRNAIALRLDHSSARVIKREITPGTVTFTRQNGCSLQIPVSTVFFNDGTILRTPIQVTASGNSVPQWRNEYRKPWLSQLTDYEGGEYKFMLFKVGQHPSILIGVEESEQKMLETQTVCAAAAYQIFKSNRLLLKPIAEKRVNDLSWSLKQGWESYFSN